MKYINDRVRGITFLDIRWQLPYIDIDILGLYQSKSLFRLIYSKTEFHLELLFIELFDYDNSYVEGSEMNRNSNIFKKLFRKKT